MANDARREIELALSITTANAQALGKLRDDVKELAKEGGDAAPEFKRLADELGKLEAQAQQLEKLADLSTNLEQAAAAQKTLSATTAEVKSRLDGQTSATKAAEQAQREANAAYELARAAVKEAGAEIAQYRANADAATQKTNAYAQGLKELKVSAADAKAALAEKQKALAQTRARTDEARAAQQELTQEWRAANTESSRATTEVEQLQKQVDAVAKKMSAAGVSTKEFTAAQQEVASNVTQAKAALGALITETDRKAAAAKAAAAEEDRLAIIQLNRMKELQAAAKAEADGIIRDYERMAQADRERVQATQQAATAIEQAFGTVGAQSAQQLRNEIAKVKLALELLRTEGGLTGRELDTAIAAGNGRIKELERDLRSATGELTLADKAANLFSSALGKITVGNLAARGMEYLINQASDVGRAFLEANMKVETLQRGLTSIYGSSATAASQLDFLRKTAMESGVAVGDISDVFVRFSASAQQSNIPMEQSNALFQEMARVSGLLGLSSVKVEQGLEAIGQMAAKGTVSMEELRQQLGDAIPGATALAAKGLGMTQEELIKLVESGNLSARQFIPAFTNALKGLTGENDTLRGAIARVSNAITEFYQSASDSAAIKGLTAGLNALAANFSTVVDVAYGLGKALLALKLLDYVKNLSLFGTASRQVAADITTQTTATTANTAATAGNTAAINANTAAKRANATAGAAVGTAATGAAGGVTAFGTAIGVLSGVLSLFGTAARGVFTLLGGWPMLLATVAMNAKELGTWIGETAARMVGWGKVMDEANRKLEESAKKEKELIAAKAEAARQADLRMQKELEGLTKAREAQDAKTSADEKATDAAKKQGEVIERLADLRGNEQAKLEAATQATNLHLAAAQKEAADKLALVQAIEAELAKRQELMASSAQVTVKMKEELQKLQELLEKKRAEADASAAMAMNLKFEASSREVAAQAYQNNADKVEQYRQRLDGANQSLSAVLAMEQQGLPVAQAVTAARIEQAKAERLYNDAVADKKQQIELATASEQADIQVMAAKLNLRKAEMTNMLESAKAIGDHSQVQYASIELKQVEIELLKLSVKSEILKQESLIAVTKAQRDQLLATNELTPAKKLELETTIKQAEAEIMLAKARGAQVENLQREAQALRENTANTDANGRASRTVAGDKGREAGSRDKNAGAIDKENDALAKQNELRKVGNDYVNKQGMVTDAKGNVITGMATSLETLQLKQRAGTLSAADLDLAKAAMEHEYAKYQMYASFQGSGLGSIQGNIRGGYDQAKNLYEDLLAQKSAAEQKSSTTTTKQTSSSVTPVVINLNGTSTKVNVASSADATALQNLLQQLANGATRTI